MAGETEPERVAFDLTGVPETLLWNLHHRALAAGDPGSGLSDPLAIEIVTRLDYATSRVATGHDAFAARWHALRVRTFDDELRRLLDRSPDATVVCLGEGLETQFWRVDNGRVRWLSVDLDETIALRRQLLPDHPRATMLIGSATEDTWTGAVDRTRPAIVTAQGLLMYFDRAEVHRVIAMIAARLPAATLLFDTVPESMMRARERRSAADGSSLAAWHWVMSATERRDLAALPAIRSLVQLPPPRGHGVLFGAVLPVMRRIPGARDWFPAFPVFRAELADPSAGNR
jgi:O-methyltransferase involved in polyketide biosynthesis